MLIIVGFDDTFYIYYTLTLQGEQMVHLKIYLNFFVLALIINYVNSINFNISISE